MSAVVFGTTFSVWVSELVVSVELLAVVSELVTELFSVLELTVLLYVAICVWLFFLNRLSFVGKINRMSPTMIRQIIVQIRQMRA